MRDHSLPIIIFNVNFNVETKQIKVNVLFQYVHNVSKLNFSVFEQSNGAYTQHSVMHV